MPNPYSYTSLSTGIVIVDRYMYCECHSNFTSYGLHKITIKDYCQLLLTPTSASQFCGLPWFRTGVPPSAAAADQSTMAIISQHPVDWRLKIDQAHVKVLWCLISDNCTSSEFACLSNYDCINSSERCDGVSQCVDASDETYCCNIYLLQRLSAMSIFDRYYVITYMYLFE